MECTTQKDQRQGIRLLLGLIALCIFGYLAEIFFMGAPDFRKHSDRTYYHDKDPAAFWTEFALFSAAGLTAAYFSINWKKGLQLINALDEHDKKNLEAMGPEYVQRVQRGRKIQAFCLCLAGALIIVLLLMLTYPL